MAKVTKTKIGRVMLLNKGTYNVETAYSELDVVKESGRTYICLKNCKGIQPTNTEYWILAADIGISPINKEDYNTEEEKSLYANELFDYGKIALDEYTAEKVEQLIAKEGELEGVLDIEKDKQIGIVNDKTGNYNANAETKTLAFNTNASDKAAAFDTNVETKTSAFDTNAETKASAFNTNASDKTSAFNANAESKTSAFNTNASEKTASFNQNASDKVAEFDDVKNDLLGQADDLFDALTTNEASGNELYIDDAKACRVISSEIDGMYKQETTEGYNLFNLNTILSNYYISVTGTVETSNYSNSSDYIEVKANKTYLISYNYNTLSNTAKRRIATYNLDKTFLTTIEYELSQKSVTITPSENGYIRFSYDINCTDVQVVEGTENKTYEPYTGRNSISKSRLSAGN